MKFFTKIRKLGFILLFGVSLFLSSGCSLEGKKTSESVKIPVGDNWLKFGLHIMNNNGSSETSNLSSNVQIFVDPDGSGDTVRPNRPLIFLKGGEMVCRPQPFKAHETRILLEQEGLDQNVLEEFFGLEKQKDLNNANRESDKNFLVIDNLYYSATASHEGEVFSHSGSITKGYCDSEARGDVPPYLYFVSPHKKIEYSPTSSNSFNNLTIYISDFPISNQNNLVVIPAYTVELTLTGHFMTSSGQIIENFTKRIKFSTQSPI